MISPGLTVSRTFGEFSAEIANFSTGLRNEFGWFVHLLEVELRPVEAEPEVEPEVQAEVVDVRSAEVSAEVLRSVVSVGVVGAGDSVSCLVVGEIRRVVDEAVVSGFVAELKGLVLVWVVSGFGASGVVFEVD